MAQIHLKAPAQFNFRNPDEWSKWRKRFEQYRFASKLDGESQARQISTLMYCLGEEAESVLDSTSPTTEEKTSYAEVLKKFDGYFKVRKNVIYERAKFNRRNQLPEKTAAITKMPVPTNVSELRRFLGMVNQLGKFSSNLANIAFSQVKVEPQS